MKLEAKVKIPNKFRPQTELFTIGDDEYQVYWKNKEQNSYPLHGKNKMDKTVYFLNNGEFTSHDNLNTLVKLPEEIAPTLVSLTIEAALHYLKYYLSGKAGESGSAEPSYNKEKWDAIKEYVLEYILALRTDWYWLTALQSFSVGCDFVNISQDDEFFGVKLNSDKNGAVGKNKLGRIVTTYQVMSYIQIQARKEKLENWLIEIMPSDTLPKEFPPQIESVQNTYLKKRPLLKGETKVHEEAKTGIKKPKVEKAPQEVIVDRSALEKYFINKEAYNLYWTRDGDYKKVCPLEGNREADKMSTYIFKSHVGHGKHIDTSANIPVPIGPELSIKNAELALF